MTATRNTSRKSSKGRWKQEEDEMIEHLQIMYGKKWSRVLAEAFPERTEEAIRKRWHIRSKELWSIGEDKQLIDLVNSAHFETRAVMKEWWESVSVSLPSKDMNQCIDHWFNILGPSRMLQRWTTEEDRKLTALCSLYGNKWVTIAQYFPRRSSSTLRKRWRFIIANIKGDNDEIQAYNNTKERAITLLKSSSTPKVSFKEISRTKKVSPKVCSFTTKSSEKQNIEESKLCDKIELNDMDALIKAVNDNIKKYDEETSCPVDTPLLSSNIETVG